MSLLKANTTKRCRANQGRRGVTTVEMSIVLPIFLLILFSFIEISRLSFAVNSTQVALIRGTRFLSLRHAEAEAGKSAAISYLTSLGYDKNNIDIEVTPSVITDTTPEVTLDITLDMAPLPYTVANTLTRSRE